MKVSAGAVSMLLLCIARGWCGLEFDERILNLQSSPRERKVEATFHFKNTGSVPVTIKRVKTSCGCTTARLEKERYEPGEEGALHAVFRYGFEKGRLRKLLSVLTDDAASPEIGLEIRVVVADTAEITPRLVYWRVGEPSATKTLRVALQPDIRIIGVKTDDPEFEVQLRRNAREYVIEVRPKQTDTRSGAKIELVTEYQPGKTQSYTAYARVK